MRTTAIYLIVCSVAKNVALNISFGSLMNFPILSAKGKETIMTIKYSQVKAFKAFCDSLDSSPDYREVLQNILDGESDFEVDGVRFINSNDIDQIQQEELESDLYCLGCFNAWFIADVTGIDIDVIESMQKAEAFEAIGKLIVSLGKLAELQEAYASADGFGQHFNRYDGSEGEFRINGETFHVFDKG